MSDPRSCEIRITWVGGGPLVVRGRLAWLILKLAQKGASELAEDLDRIHDGQMDVSWNGRGVFIHTRRGYNWPGERA